MTTIHALTLAFSAVGFPALLLSKRKSQPRNNNSWLEQLKLDRNPYQSLRFLAITTPPYKYNGIQVDSVYGFVMDYPVKNGTATLSAYITGESSLYMSNGNGIINGERYDASRAAATDLVKLVSGNMKSSVLTTRFPIAASGYVRFYILTTEGVRTSWMRLSDLNGHDEEGTLLFIEAGKVIRSLQLTTILN
jgi:hypothetical protein